jgi:hypothetical protein
MRPWVAVLCGVALIVAAALALAPASLLDARIAALSGGRARIANASGTLWNGSGELVLQGSERRAIAWHLDPRSLFRGEVRGTFANDGDPNRGAQFVVGRDKLELDGFDLSMPMSALLRAAGAPAFLSNVGGDVGLRVDRFNRGADMLDVQAAMQWRGASLPAFGPYPSVELGDVHAELAGSGPEVSGPIANSGGELEIEGTVTATASGTPRLDARIRPREGLDPNRAQAIAAALATVGSPDPRGGYRLVWPRNGR